MSLFAELKRRNVFRVVAAYVVTAWLLLQVADVVLNNVDAPRWVFHTIALLLAIGLVLVTAFSWAFEITPDGVKREREVDRSQSITAATGRKLDRLLIVVLALALGYFVIEKFALSDRPAVVEEVTTVRQPAEATPPSVNGAEVDRSIAVLPFADLSPNRDQEYFSDGLSEELLNLLAKVPELRVAARTSSFYYKGRDSRIDEIGRELGVAHLLEGSVRTAGERIRVTAQLIKVDDGFHLWSETYDRTLDDVFAIQDEIARAVVEALRVRMLGEVPHAAETTAEAYPLYLQALHLANQHTEGSAARAIELLEQVLQLDPGYAPAWSALGRNYRNQAVTGELDESEASTRAMAALDRALELDPELADAHALRAMVQLEWSNDPVAAAQSFRRALEVNPNDTAVMLSVAQFHNYLDDHETAASLIEEALRRNPVDALAHIQLGDMYRLLGKEEAARKAWRTAFNLNPDIYRARYELGLSFLEAGELDAAWVEFDGEPDPEYRLKGLALVAHARGNAAEFERLFGQLREEYGERWPSEIAHVYAWTGAADGAFEWLDRALRVGEAGLPASRDLLLLEPLHDDPRWQAWLERVGISDAQLDEIRREVSGE